MAPGWCVTSAITSLWSEQQCHGKSSDSVQHLLNFSWDRDVVDIKVCLRTYQENEINVVPSMYNSMW